MRPTVKTLLPALAISLTLAACGGSSTGTSSTAQTSSSAAAATAASTTAASATSAAGVKTATNASLGATVVVDAQGKTLYHLSGEQSGHFLCTSAACVAAWPPVSADSGSSAVSGLAPVKRPDGTEQLAYNGEPLYTFSGDKGAGEANGQGIKADGGTWSAVRSAGSASAAQSSEASAPASPGGEGYKY